MPKYWQQRFNVQACIRLALQLRNATTEIYSTCVISLDPVIIIKGCCLDDGILSTESEIQTNLTIPWSGGTKITVKRFCYRISLVI